MLFGDGQNSHASVAESLRAFMPVIPINGQVLTADAVSVAHV